ncbi:hypothetical protein [Gelidibacter algens]|nr:hypothetical protein [Gelidibacter algens]
MNKIRYIGLAVLIIGLVFQFTMDNDAIDFIPGLLIGLGIGLLLTGKIRTSAS